MENNTSLPRQDKSYFLVLENNEAVIDSVFKNIKGSFWNVYGLRVVTVTKIFYDCIGIGTFAKNIILTKNSPIDT